MRRKVRRKKADEYRVRRKRRKKSGLVGLKGDSTVTAANSNSTLSPAPSRESKPLFAGGSDGRIVASVDPARNRWLGEFLAECDRGRVYVADLDGLTRNEVNGCPVSDPQDEDGR